MADRTQGSRRLAQAGYWLLAGAALALTVIAFSPRALEAHKAVTSKYDYNKDVFPLLRDHCGECHVAGGPAPMSLLTYKDAVAWAEAVRDELTAERMPPWPIAGQSPAVNDSRPLNAHDLDVIVTWASGGTPLGAEARLPDTKFVSQWKLGAPDLKIQMDAPHTLPPGTLDEMSDFTLATGLTQATWVKAADLLPGTPSLARDAIISVENGPVLALWQPGGDAAAAPGGAAFKLPAGAKLHLQIHYKKHFDVEQEAVSDRSTIGLYFTDPPASGRELQSVTMTVPEGGSASAADLIVNNLPTPARIVAIRPLLDQPYGAVDVTATSPAGNRVSLLSLHAPRPQWFRRYWLKEPVEVAGGTRISVALQPLPSTTDEPKRPQRFPLQIAVDYIPE